MLFKYVGLKRGGVPVTFPVGVRSRLAVKKTVYADPFVEVADEEAEKFLSLYNHPGELPVFEAVEESERPASIEVREVAPVVAQKKRGRKAKPQIVETVE